MLLRQTLVGLSHRAGPRAIIEIASVGLQFHDFMLRSRQATDLRLTEGNAKPLVQLFLLRHAPLAKASTLIAPFKTNNRSPCPRGAQVMDNHRKAYSSRR